MKELKIRRPYGQTNTATIARAQELGGFHRSYANYRAERQYIDTYVVPEGVTEAMLLAEPTPEPAPVATPPRSEQGIAYTVPLGNGKVRTSHTRRFTWDD